MRRVFHGALAAAVLLGTACFTPTPCETDAECGDGVCWEKKFCVTGDAGLGGGSGGGGGATGGGGGGGGTDAGTDGGGVPGPCEGVACGAEAECRATSQDAGECVSRFERIEWERPDGGMHGPAVPVPLQARLVVKAGFAAAGFPNTLAYAVAPAGTFVAGVLTHQAGGRYVAPSLAVTGAVPTGAWTVTTALADGGLAATAGFTTDTTKPVVVLHVEAPPSRAAEELDADSVNRWKKSEAAAVQTEATEDVAIAPGDFTTAGVGVAGSTRCARQCGTGRFCRCFEVELGLQGLDAGVGAVGVSLGAVADAVGNVSDPATGEVAVTRFKWRRQVATNSTGPTAVSVRADGTVITGAKTGTSGSELVAVTPGGVSTALFSSSTWTVTAGPMVGAQGDVYVGQFDGTNSKVVKNPGTGQVERCLSNSGTYDGDLALVTPGATEVAVAVRSDGFLSPATTGCVPSVITGGVNGRPTVIATGTTAFVAGSGGAPIWKFTAADTIPLAGGSTSTGTLFPANLFLASDAGITLVGGGGGPTVGGVFAFRDAVTLPANTTNATPGTTPGGPAVVGRSDAGHILFYGDNSQVVRRLPMSAVPDFPSPAAASAALGTSSTRFGAFAPVVGSHGKLYVVGRDGVVRALDAATLQETWTWGAGVLPANVDGAISQLNLDIDRSSATPCAAGQPGVLYVAATRSNVTTLYALLVDSQGVDRSAPWPRHQHDPANTGNPATSLAPWSCP